MVKSMTAFAKTQLNESWGQLSWEIRSVNNRFLDLHFKLPENLRELEMGCRQLIKQYCDRGKMDMSLKLHLAGDALPKIVLNDLVLAELASALKSVKAHLKTEATTDMASLLRYPGLVNVEEKDLSVFHEAILSSFETALKKLIEMREKEGAALKIIMLDKLSEINAIVASIKPELPMILDQHETKLRERVASLVDEVDEERLGQEMLYIAQKTDVTEELDRLAVHSVEVEALLNDTAQSIGRRLDFLIQELHREANTLGSKSIHEKTTKASVALKVLIEQLREQAQNIE